jgi:hypothetical protein
VAPLHIVIDVRRVRDFGIGTYIRNITRAVSRLDQENRYTLLARPEDLDQFEGLGPNFKIAPVPASDRGLWHNLQIPGLSRLLKASLSHIPLNSVAWRMPLPYVVTIHDMSTLLFPEQKTFRSTLHQERYRRGAARAARVITVSNATRRDIETVLRVPPGRISTIYSAPDPAFTCEPGNPDQDRQILPLLLVSFYLSRCDPWQKNNLCPAPGGPQPKLEQPPLCGNARLLLVMKLKEPRRPKAGWPAHRYAARFLVLFRRRPAGVSIAPRKCLLPSLYEGPGRRRCSHGLRNTGGRLQSAFVDRGRGEAANW